MHALAAIVIAIGAGVAIAVGISGRGSKGAAPPTSTAVRTTPPTTAPGSLPLPPARVPRPRIVWKPIPFPSTRLTETAAYSLRHYGLDTWRLRHPHVIVEHYTASTTMISAWSLFARDVPDSGPDARVTSPHGVADAALPHPPWRRDRTRREPHLALPP
jgi:hypothetical protein